MAPALVYLFPHPVDPLVFGTAQAESRSSAPIEAVTRWLMGFLQQVDTLWRATARTETVSGRLPRYAAAGLYSLRSPSPCGSRPSVTIP